jgi:hypothetical protein
MITSPLLERELFVPGLLFWKNWTKTMSKTVMLELPEEIAQSATEVASRTHRSLEDVLVEWLDRSAAQIPVDVLPDERVLQLSRAEMDAHLQADLSELLAKNREASLTPIEQRRLDELMKIYRQGLLRKAEALKVAVDRNLIPPLSQ